MEADYFYPIRFPLSLLRKDIFSIENLYITTETIFPLYQIKYLQIKYNIPQNSFTFLNQTTSNDLFMLYSLENYKLNAIKNLDFYPYFSNIPLDGLNKIKSMIISKPFLYNFYYMNGEIARLFGEFSESLDFFLKGIGEKDFYCYLFLSRIYVEPGLLLCYSQERSPEKTLNYLLDSFFEFGLFDKPFESLSGLYLLYLYYDSFKDFRSLVELERQSDSLKGMLLDLLISLDFLRKETFEKFTTLKERLLKSKTNHILLGDLMQSCFFGSVSDFSLKIYQKGLIANPESISYNLRIFHEYKIKNSYEHLTAIFRKVVLGNKALMFSQEFLHYQILEDPEFIDNKISDYTISQASRVLEFGDYDILMPLFRIFKQKEKSIKSGDDPLAKQGLQQSLYKIAVKLCEKDPNNEFNKGPFAYCLEKAKGCNRDFNKSLELYESLLLRTLENRMDPFFFTYRLGSLLSLEYELKTESDKLVDIAYRRVIITLKKKLKNITSLYDFAKVLKKKGETDLQRQCYRFIVKLSRDNTSPMSFTDKLLYNSSVAKLNDQSTNSSKDADIEEFFKNIIENISIETSSETQDYKQFKEIFKIIKKMIACRKSPHKTNKPSTFMSAGANESYKERTVSNFNGIKFGQDKTNKEVGIIKSGVLKFETLVKNTFSKLVHIIPKDSIIWISKSQAKLENGQIFTGFKKTFNFDSVGTLISYFKRIKNYLKCSQNSGILKLIALSIEIEKPGKLKSCFLFEPIKETLEEYISRTKHKTPFKLFFQIAKLFKFLQESNCFLKYLNKKSFVRTHNGLFKLIDPEFCLLYKEKNMINEKEISEKIGPYLAPEGFYLLTKRQTTQAQMSIASSLWSFGILVLDVIYGDNFKFLNTKCKTYDDFKAIFKQESFDLEIKRLFEIKDPKIPIKIIKSLLRINPTERVLSEQQYFKIDKSSVIQGQFYCFCNENTEYYLENSLLYVGDLLDSKPHNFGRLADGKCSFEGQFFEGLMNGYGVMKLGTKETFAGDVYLNFMEFNEFDILHNISEFIKINFDPELASLFKDDLIKNYLQRSRDTRAFPGEGIGLQGLEFVKKELDKEKPLLIVRYNANPLKRWETIYSEDLKEGFAFFWSIDKLGFFEVKKEGKMKQNLIKGRKGNLQGIRCFFKSQIIEIGFFKGYNGKMVKGLIFEYDENYKLIKRFRKEFGEILEAQNFEIDLKYEGTFDVEGKKSGLGKEIISGEIEFEGIFSENIGNGRGLFRDLKTTATVFEGFVNNYKPIYGKFYKKNGVLEAIISEKEGRVYLNGCFFYKERIYQGLFSEDELWIKEEIYEMNEKGTIYKGFLEDGEFKDRGVFENLDEGYKISGIFDKDFSTGVLEINKNSKVFKGLKKIIGNFCFNEQRGIKFLTDKIYEIHDENDGIYLGFLTEKGKYNGYGILTKNKSSFAGEFQNGLRHGFGELKKTLKIQGDDKEYKYSGFWKFGRRFGLGQVFKNSKLSYEGIFVDNHSFYGAQHILNIPDCEIQKIEGNFSIEKISKEIVPKNCIILELKKYIKVETHVQNFKNISTEELIGSIKYSDSSIYEGYIKNFKGSKLGFFYKPSQNQVYYSGEVYEGVIQGFGFMTLEKKESFGFYMNGIIQSNNFAKKESLDQEEIRKNTVETVSKNGLKMVKMYSKKEKKMKVFLLE